MSENPPMQHVETERLSALLEEPGSDLAASDHLERCAVCRAEFETLSRMRMALSGLGDLDPPPGAWERILRTLDSRTGGGFAGRTAGDPGWGASRSAGGHSTASRAPGYRSGWWRTASAARWPVQLAAGFLLFAGGLVAGIRFAEPAGGRLAEGPAATAPAGTRAGGPTGAEGQVLPVGARSGAEAGDTRETEALYLQALSELARLRLPRGGDGDASLDPVEAAERLARIDALIEASRDALERAPGDPVASGLLFELLEERAYLAGGLNQSLRLASLEYR